MEIYEMLNVACRVVAGMVYLQVENHSENIDDASSSFTSPSYAQPYSINLSTLATIFGRIYPCIIIFLRRLLRISADDRGSVCCWFPIISSHRLILDFATPSSCSTIDSSVSKTVKIFFSVSQHQIKRTRFAEIRI